MTDYLRIYVLWAPGHDHAAEVAEGISRHFDGLGMERDGVAVRIPVRFRSEAWIDGSVAPRDIDLGEAQHNAVILLNDDFMYEHRAAWDQYVTELRSRMDARGPADVYISIGSPTGEQGLSSDVQRLTQYARRDLWRTASLTPKAMKSRLLLHIVYRLRAHFRALYRPGGADEPLFVSHAKADGDEIARAIVDHVNSTSQDVPLHAFYDAKELMPGEDFGRVFEDEIGRGTLLAIVSDVYDSRPWCVLELTIAKRARRPIVLVDVGKVKTSRTYPYGANLPRVRPEGIGSGTDWIEEVLVEVMSEGLRCDLFSAEAELLAIARGISKPVIIPRPPELFDLVEVVADGETVIYPDPPLNRTEQTILDKANRSINPVLQLKTLSQIR